MKLESSSNSGGVATLNIEIDDHLDTCKRTFQRKKLRIEVQMW